MKIGVELNGIVRDINTQILKYYKKDINKDFDDENVDLNVVDFVNKLDFGGKKKRDEFLYVDYPYEVFGCARVMSRNLASKINNWMLSFENREENVEIVFFSTNEVALTIQSTYYFLSKIGCRVREMYFPKSSKEIWDVCDVIITQNENIVNSAPKDKKVILIEKNDNDNLKENVDYSYESLNDIINDEFFLKKLDKRARKHYSFNRIIKKIKNFLIVNGKI